MLENLAQSNNGVWQDLVGGNICNGTDCDYAALIRLANAVINNLTVIAVLAATMAFIWVGFQLLKSQGDPGAMKNAKTVGGNVVTGLFFVLAAWVIVKTITSVLLSPDFLNSSII